MISPASDNERLDREQCAFDAMARRMVEHVVMPMIEAAVARGDILTAKRLARKLDSQESPNVQ